MTKEEIIKGIKDKGLYDFLAQDSWKLSKEELKTIAKEIAYLLNNNEISYLIKELREVL